METVSRPNHCSLVADIGGTNARFAMADPSTVQLSHILQFPCSGHASAAAAIQAYLEHVDQRPTRACLAVAAPVLNETIRFTNSDWIFTQDELRREIGFEEIIILNDFHALALAVPTLETHELFQVGGGVPPGDGTKVVLGAGTGIGVAGLVCGPAGWIAVPSEGGHISLACNEAAEFALTQTLRANEKHISVERFISGPGIAELYRLVSLSRGLKPSPLMPDEVLARALSEMDDVAVETLRLFVRWFGSFAGDAALLFGATGGVYIGGGIAPKILELLGSGAFRQPFEAKGSMRHFLEPIPIYVILAEYATLRGAAIHLGNSADA